MAKCNPGSRGYPMATKRGAIRGGMKAGIPPLLALEGLEGAGAVPPRGKGYSLDPPPQRGQGVIKSMIVWLTTCGGIPGQEEDARA